MVISSYEWIVEIAHSNLALILGCHDEVAIILHPERDHLSEAIQTATRQVNSTANATIVQQSLNLYVPALNRFYGRVEV